MVDRILIIDDLAASRIVLKLKLAAACYEPLLASSGAEGLALARSAIPNLIIVEMTLPDMAGTDVLRRLRADPRTRSIPVMMIGTDHDDTGIAALRAGADEFLPKPLNDVILLARLRNLLRVNAMADEMTASTMGLAEEPAAFDGPGTVALVTQRPETAQRWQSELRGKSSDILLALTREEVLAEARTPPDLYLIDSDLGGTGAGLRLMSDLRSRSATRNIPVCIVQNRPTAEAVAISYDLGANDVVAARFDAVELSLRIKTLLRLKRRWDTQRASVEDGLRMAMIDPLTGLHNRRFALPQLAAMAERAKAEVADLAVLVIDLDRFKSVNDRWGHATGDAVLVEVANRLSLNLRPSDLLARIGGEEFLIALPDVQLAAARAVADRLCKTMEETPVTLPSGETLRVTISIGLATRGRRGSEPVSETMERADHALLLSKTAGRNQVTVGACPRNRGQMPFSGPARLQ